VFKNKIGFIRIDNRKYETIYEKIKRIVRKVFIIVKFETIEAGFLILIPEYIKYNTIIKFVIEKQINRIKRKNNIEEFVMEENLKLSKLDINKKQLLDGKCFMKYSILKIFEYIFDYNISMSLEDIYVFVNSCNEENLYLLNKMISKFKTVNIITKNLKAYRKLEEKLYKQGILITVSNNKKKSSKMAKYVVNIDFSKSEFEKYNIRMDAIIINLTNECCFFTNRFNGVIINGINIKIDENNNYYKNEFYGNINNTIYLESVLKTGSKNCLNIDEFYSKYNAQIIDVVGTRGVIQKCEFLA
jgi:hypothetical protein